MTINVLMRVISHTDIFHRACSSMRTAEPYTVPIQQHVSRSGDLTSEKYSR